MGEDSWERFSGRLSSFSLSLLPALLFTLVMAYVVVAILRNAHMSFTVNGSQITVNYPRISIPLDYGSIRNSVIALFAAVLIGLPVPLMGDRKTAKMLVSLVQAAAFIYGLYVFVRAIVNFASVLT